MFIQSYGFGLYSANEEKHGFSGCGSPYYIMSRVLIKIYMKRKHFFIPPNCDMSTQNARSFCSLEALFTFSKERPFCLSNGPHCSKLQDIKVQKYWSLREVPRSRDDAAVSPQEIASLRSQ
jgi:hypothetical protein